MTMTVHVSPSSSNVATRSTSQAATKTRRLELRIGGMTCAHCPPAIEKALIAVPGVTAAQVNPATRVARIDYDPAQARTARPQ